MTETFIALLFAHTLADFILQSDWIVRNKRNPLALGLHGLIVGVTAVAATGAVHPALLVLVLVHLGIDVGKLVLAAQWKGSAGFGPFVVDQTLHVASLFALALWLPDLWANGLWAPGALTTGTDGGILGTGILRGVDRVHPLRIGEAGDVGVQVPDEFTMRSVYLRTFFPAEASLPLSEPARWARAMERAQAEDRVVRIGGQAYVRTGRVAEAGKPVVNFEILTGDMLFVDKMRYHFVAPDVGDPFVFRTGNIPELRRGGDQYYIKRLVGLPGDTLALVDGALSRPGHPAEDAASPIGLNNARAADRNYFGYLARCSPSDAMPLEMPRRISDRGYFAMGDNSSNSYDSRGWGEVPRADAVGPAFVIIYPFTHRWGMAR